MFCPRLCHSRLFDFHTYHRPHLLQPCGTTVPKLQKCTLIVSIKAINFLAIILLRGLTPPLAPPLRRYFYVKDIILYFGAISQKSSLCRQQNRFRNDLLSLISVRVV